MYTKKEIQDIVNEISYKDWFFRVGNIGDSEDHYFLQVIFNAPDNITGVMSEQRCRKQLMSVFMCKSEIIRTAYKLVIDAEMHEIGEHFKYKGELVENPHTDYEAKYEIIKAGRLDERIPNQVDKRVA